MSIRSNANREDIEGKLSPEVEAQRSLVADPATDPKELLAKENDPILATAGENAEQVDDDAEPQ
jgi:hypothetical protein